MGGRFTGQLSRTLVDGKKKAAYVFTRNGNNEKIDDFRDEWEELCTKSGLGRMICRKCSTEDHEDVLNDGKCPVCGKRPNHPRSGISERVAMRISGHKTRAVFDRYDIVSDRDLVDAARKIETRQRTEFSHTLVIPAENDASAAPVLKATKPQ